MFRPEVRFNPAAVSPEVRPRRGCEIGSPTSRQPTRKDRQVLRFDGLCHFAGEASPALRTRTIASIFASLQT